MSPYHVTFDNRGRHFGVKVWASSEQNARQIATSIARRRCHNDAIETGHIVEFTPLERAAVSPDLAPALASILETPRKEGAQ